MSAPRATLERLLDSRIRLTIDHIQFHLTDRDLFVLAQQMAAVLDAQAKALRTAVKS